MNAAGLQWAAGRRMSVERRTESLPSVSSMARKTPCDDPEALEQAALTAEPPAPPPQGRPGAPGGTGFWTDAGRSGASERGCPAPTCVTAAPSATVPDSSTTCSTEPGGPSESVKGTIEWPDSAVGAARSGIALSGVGGAVGDVGRIVGGPSGEAIIGGASAAGEMELLGGVSIGTVPEEGSGVIEVTGLVTGVVGPPPVTGTAGASVTLGGAASGLAVGPLPDGSLRTVVGGSAGGVGGGVLSTGAGGVLTGAGVGSATVAGAGSGVGSVDGSGVTVVPPALPPPVSAGVGGGDGSAGGGAGSVAAGVGSGAGAGSVAAGEVGRASCWE